MIAVFLAIVLVFYFTVLWNLRRHNRIQRNGAAGCRRRTIKYLCFGGHVGLYAVVSSLLFVGTIFIFINVVRYAKVTAVIEDECNINEFIDIRNRIHVIASGAILLWLVRMIFDPVILLATDFRSLVPFVLSSDLQPLNDAESVCNTVTRSESLKWRRNLVHCDLNSKENTISAWDMKN
uniref:G_PROTEIN_RECEP_F1_2 domain-containing protein n=1 Tax=Steinernema glaseri TaxID=37863 RepID=A0A1I7Y883_9BILA